MRSPSFCVAAAVLWPAACLLVFAPSALCESSGFANYDGDTFRATFRLAGVDTAEIRGNCPEERELALRAKRFTEDFLKSGGVISHRSVSTDTNAFSPRCAGERPISAMRWSRRGSHASGGAAACAGAISAFAFRAMCPWQGPGVNHR